MEYNIKRKYIIFLILISYIFGNNESIDSNSEDKITEILNSITSRYNKDISFTLEVNGNNINTLMDVDMVWLGKDSIDRKTRVHFSKPKDIEDVYMWIWALNNGKSKKWITTPGSGTKIDITNRRNKTGFDFSFIELDQSLFNEVDLVSDTTIYNERECYVLDFYKLKNDKKIGPLMKLWISIDEHNIYKIERFNKKKKIINEIIFEKYIDNFPENFTINDIKQKNKLMVNISNYKEVKFNNSFIDIFEPKDMRNDTKN